MSTTDSQGSDRDSPVAENPLMALVDAASSIYDKQPVKTPAKDHNASAASASKNKSKSNGGTPSATSNGHGHGHGYGEPSSSAKTHPSAERAGTPPLLTPMSTEALSAAGPGGTVLAASLKAAGAQPPSASPDDLKPSASLRRSLGKNGMPKRTFAEQLMDALDDPANEDVLTWMPDGTAFQITNPRYFTQHLMPNTFHIRNMSSFVRKLGRWGFSRVHETATRNSDIFRHPKFIRGEKIKCAKIKCVGGSGSTSANASHQAINDANKFIRNGGYFGRPHYDSGFGAGAGMNAYRNGMGTGMGTGMGMGMGMASRDMMINEAALLRRDAMGRPGDIYDTHSSMFQRPPTGASPPIGPESAEARKFALQQRSLRYAEEEIMQNRITEAERMQNRLRNSRLNPIADSSRSHLPFPMGGGGGGGGSSNFASSSAYRNEYLGHDPVSSMTTQVLSAAMDALRRDNETTGLAAGPLPASSHRMFAPQDEMRASSREIYAAQMMRERQMEQHQAERFRREMEQSNYFRQLSAEDPDLMIRLLHERRQQRQMQLQEEQLQQQKQHIQQQQEQQKQQQEISKEQDQDAKQEKPSASLMG